MTYKETIEYLYASAPMFQHNGISAYKPGLKTSRSMDKLLGNPHTDYHCIHVGGTNGKGSVSHTLAAILQAQGYCVGLYTSPHLVDFRERIRVNGEMISEEYVIDFVEQHKNIFEHFQASFFELTSMMAFAFFKAMRVDYAIIEVGLGGRLDTTNIIRPILSIITNISMDHVHILGNTTAEIAFEKAGIIKSYTPAIVGETEDKDVMEMFKNQAEMRHAPLHIAHADGLIDDLSRSKAGSWVLQTPLCGRVLPELIGEAQSKNFPIILKAVEVLTQLGHTIHPKAIRWGFEEACTLTGLMGRWQVLGTKPKVICDTGHNADGWKHLSLQLQKERKRCRQLYMIIGVANDKDIQGMVEQMPKEATYLFTQASIPRAMPPEEVAAVGASFGLQGECFATVEEAVEEALGKAKAEDTVFVGGSTFVVAEAIQTKAAINTCFKQAE